MAFAGFSTRFAIFINILVYVLLGNNPDAYYIFVVTSFYNTLKVMMVLHMPEGMTELGELHVSIKRIQKLLLSEEVEQEEINERNGEIQLKTHETPLIHLSNVSVKWVPESTDNTLSKINLHITNQDLVVVVGSVGSGKSTLLQVILKELPSVEGAIKVFGKISYAAQEPWLFTGSIRQNILFGEPMDQHRYREVVRVCALERDFSILPHGDASIVGDRGVMLSGGQKARINLARAIYREADIYLLDDPLSAVDTHVGKQIFEECIVNHLRSKTVILVTHQLQYLAQVDNVIVMENGNIIGQGTYEQLHEKGYFGELVGNQAEINDNEIGESYEIDEDKVDEPQQEKEQRKYGNIAGKIYRAYMNAGGGGCLALVIILIFVATQLVSSFSDYFLTFW